MSERYKDYDGWSHESMIGECLFLRDSLHRLAKEATDTKRQLTRLEDSIVKFFITRSITRGFPAPIKKLFSKTTVKDLHRILNPPRQKS